ncbi:MAG TPA: toll/interleukin-1 receptor domain-containing protein [Pyrinomonadaceae bacterium]|nr:toll/interleukin-1 receptor domain-containing protein [Pyrinomonadaceae bacterium]
MSTGKFLLGKVFISHSSVDKPFVRRLAGRIKKAGFQIWLDEHELVVGDPLGKRIADALIEAKVVLVVVSASSVKSKWLRYELSLATERMVKGACRVIPIVIDDVPLPPEVTGLIYSDFKSSFSFGIKGILTALEYEASQVASTKGFWEEVRDLLEEIFDNSGFASVSGEYQSKDYDFVTVRVPSAHFDDTEVVYEVIPAYGASVKPLTEVWWSEYQSAIEELGEKLFLIVTERPVDFKVQHPSGYKKEIGYRALLFEYLKTPYAQIVVADLSKAANREERVIVLSEAKTLLTKLAQDLAKKRK